MITERTSEPSWSIVIPETDDIDHKVGDVVENRRFDRAGNGNGFDAQARVSSVRR